MVGGGLERVLREVISITSRLRTQNPKHTMRSIISRDHMNVPPKQV